MTPTLPPPLAEYYNIFNASGKDGATLQTQFQAIVHEDWEHIPAFGPPQAPPMSSIENYTMMLGGAQQSMPDLNAEIIKVLNQDDSYTVITKISATPKEKFMEVETNGNKFEIHGIDVHVLENGKIRKTYHAEDWGRAMMQVKKTQA